MKANFAYRSHLGRLETAGALKGELDAIKIIEMANMDAEKSSNRPQVKAHYIFNNKRLMKLAESDHVLLNSLAHILSREDLFILMASQCFFDMLRECKNPEEPLKAIELYHLNRLNRLNRGDRLANWLKRRDQETLIEEFNKTFKRHQERLLKQIQGLPALRRAEAIQKRIRGGVEVPLSALQREQSANLNAQKRIDVEKEKHPLPYDYKLSLCSDSESSFYVPSYVAQLDGNAVSEMADSSRPPVPEVAELPGDDGGILSKQLSQHPSMSDQSVGFYPAASQRKWPKNANPITQNSRFPLTPPKAHEGRSSQPAVQEMGEGIKKNTLPSDAAKPNEVATVKANERLTLFLRQNGPPNPKSVASYAYDRNLTWAPPNPLTKKQEEKLDGKDVSTFACLANAVR